MDASNYGSQGINVGAQGSIIPLSNETYSLGTTDYKWKELYVGTGSVYIGDVKLSASSQPFTGSTGNSMIINSNMIPDTTNKYTLGASGASWRDLFIGPGTINIQGPAGAKNIATVGSDLEGIVYTQYGFATPFINIGPEIGVPQAVGGWQIIGTGYIGANGFVPTDLYARINGENGPTGPVYSLISNQYGPTGPTGTPSTITGPTGHQGFTGQQGPTGTTVFISGRTFTGFTGNTITPEGNTGVYFLDGDNLVVTTKNNQTNLINVSFQTYTSTTNYTNNLSATIMRNFVGMSGTNLVTPYPINLANGKAGPNGDVVFPPDVGNATTALNTSLWTISTVHGGSNPHPLNAFTVNMQALDRVDLPNGPTGVYYAIRVTTDSNTPIYSNIRMSAIQLG